MDAKTIQTYNQMAKEYDDETVNFWNRFPKTFFDKFAEVTHGKILDVGSGPGRDGFLLKRKGFNVICLDASEIMLKLCEEKGLKIVLGDFSALPFENNSFGGVWAYASLLHVPKSGIRKAIDEIRRVLKKEGIFGLGLIEGETEGYQRSAGVNMPRWFSFYKKEEVEDLLQGCGFEILYFEKFKPNSKNYLNFISKKI